MALNLSAFALKAERFARGEGVGDNDFARREALWEGMAGGRRKFDAELSIFHMD
jgi:hypothetical protein